MVSTCMHDLRVSRLLMSVPVRSCVPVMDEPWSGMRHSRSSACSSPYSNSTYLMRGAIKDVISGHHWPSVAIRGHQKPIERTAK